jgi:hypothetical protein
MPVIDLSEILKDLQNTDPILMAVLGAAFLGVCAWTGSIFVSTRSKRPKRTMSRGPVKPGKPVTPRLAASDLGTLVEALRPDDRHALGQDLARLIEKHRNKRFLAFVVVRRDAVSPMSFTFLYQALRAQTRPTAEVHEFQITVRDASELLKACTAESAHS